ncbi:peptidase [Streptomyces sp. NPDC017254]|uniref:peptidase n=1 Tax=unclassified Streptomyces TaxID=2593676 RepID=UPI00378AD9FC
MKFRRILATAVAAAVTTPVVFLSAAPAFADTKPSPASTQKPAQGEDDEGDKDDMPTLEELKAAVALAQKEYDEAVVDLAEAKAAVDALSKQDHVLVVAAADATKAAGEAATAKTAADEALAKAQKALAELPAEATEGQKAAATAAVTAAQQTADAATAAKTAADARLTKASKELLDANLAASKVFGLAEKVKKAAAETLAAAEEELEFFEEIGGNCAEDEAVDVALSGPKTVTAGKSAVFSLRVTNTSDRPLDAVDAFTNAAALPDGREPIDEDGYFKQYITVEWSSDDVLEWTPISEEFDSVEVGKLVKGGSADVKLRLTVDPEAPVGPGVLWAVGEYENNDGTCGIGQEFGRADFDILAAQDEKPEPKPTPSATTATPTPAPTHGGNSNTTRQGGSSNTTVNGTLAATGANENLTRLGFAAAATVALGAGAMVAARRRKAGASL